MAEAWFVLRVRPEPDPTGSSESDVIYAITPLNQLMVDAFAPRYDSTRSRALVRVYADEATLALVRSLAGVSDLTPGEVEIHAMEFLGSTLSFDQIQTIMYVRMEGTP